MGSCRAIVIAVATLLLAACDSPRKSLDEHDLAVAAGQLQSIAAQAQWLTQQVSVHSVTVAMAFVQQEALADDAVRVAGDLARPAPRELIGERARLAQASMQLQQGLPQIAQAASDPAALDALQGRFSAAAAATGRPGSRS